MSVSVNFLSKHFGKQKAVDRISFDIKPNEIVGFLGPNGAGKSTTMKMLTGYIPATSGDASVCGFSIHDQGLDIRKRIGYLPESNPLYYEMYIKEFLNFVYQFTNIDESREQAMERVVEMTGLQPEINKKIGQLSKGFKQRVGLAQALMNNPEVLILDEPTSGLDPNQLEDIRALIKDLGREKTVILSTHIMQEVEAVCNRVILINKGRIVADDSIDVLRGKGSQQLILNLEFKGEVSTDDLKSIEGVMKVIKNGNRVELTAGSDIRERIFDWAKENNHTLLSISMEQKNLEDVFKELTK